MNVFFSLASGSGAAPSVAATSALWASCKSRTLRYECPRHSAFHAGKKRFMRFYKINFHKSSSHAVQFRILAPLDMPQPAAWCASVLEPLRVISDNLSFWWLKCES